MPIIDNPSIRTRPFKSEKVKRTEQATKIESKRREIRWSYVAYASIGALVIIACNTVSVMGQLRFASTAFTTYGFTGQIIYSLACETIALFLGATALISDLEDNPAGVYKLLSALAGILIGLANYSHDPGTILGITFGFFSAITPHLWDILGRVLARPILIRNGSQHIKQKFLRFTLRHWVFSPIRTARMSYHEITSTSTDPKVARAIREYNARQDRRKAEKVARRTMEHTNLDSELSEMEPVK